MQSVTHLHNNGFWTKCKVIVVFAPKQWFNGPKKETFENSLYGGIFWSTVATVKLVTVIILWKIKRQKHGELWALTCSKVI